MSNHYTENSTGITQAELEQVKSGISQYRRSRFSAANDDRLRQHVKDIPSYIILGISAVDYGPSYVHMRIEKSLKTPGNSKNIGLLNQEPRLTTSCLRIF